MNSFAKDILFVDVGHSKCSLTLTRFWINKARILSEKSERNFGGRDLDVAVAKQLVETFKQQTGVDVSGHPKTWLILIEAAKKAREHLSIAKVANI